MRLGFVFNKRIIIIINYYYIIYCRRRRRRRRRVVSRVLFTRARLNQKRRHTFIIYDNTYAYLYKQPFALRSEKPIKR